ncbi:MAG TPA: serine hydrolase [Gemmatimonadales bacterium]|jgi:CubicO group peptidase (beta-lactamase class C family)|nr:serine hydrolase [Gemmatimonadales bacterium]
MKALLALAVLASPLAAQRPTTPALPRDFDAYVARVMSTFEIPGIAIAVVKDGRVLLAKGYGVRKLGDPTPVDDRTLFGIASNTKAFTATAIGILVEEGKLQWDAPVITYLPWFQMYDPFVTRELTIRDLLVHRSGLGLGAGDLLWWPTSTYDRKEIARRLRYIKPETSFRSAYAYDNVLYSVAGEVIEAVSGQTWEDFVTSRILARVGMTGSSVRHSAAAGGGNVATPHAEIDGRVRPISPFGSDNVNPAGGINASATDIAKWLMVQLDSGRLADGSRLFKPQTTFELWSIVTPYRVGRLPADLAAQQANLAGYALGFEVRDLRGRKVVTHTGGLPGFVSRITLVPDERLGIAVFTNQEIGQAFQAITWRLLDHFTGAAPTDWVAVYRARKVRQDSIIGVQEHAAAAARDSASRPSLPLAKYAGAYRDAWYGDISIALENGKLVMRFSHSPPLTGDLEHFQYNTFIARWRDRELRADAYVTFALKPDGSIEDVKLAPVSPATDFSFDFQDLLLLPTPVP